MDRLIRMNMDHRLNDIRMSRGEASINITDKTVKLRKSDHISMKTGEMKPVKL